jgi:hypothetical protein
MEKLAKDLLAKNDQVRLSWVFCYVKAAETANSSLVLHIRVDFCVGFSIGTLFLENRSSCSEDELCLFKMQSNSIKKTWSTEIMVSQSRRPPISSISFEANHQ